MPIAFGDIALLDRKGGDDCRRTEDQLIMFEELAHAFEHHTSLHLGARDLGDAESKTLFDVPNDVGLELVAMILIQRLESRGVGESAQHLEAFMRFPEIGMRFLDDDAGIGELEGGTLDDFRHFGIDWRYAEIPAEGDALGPLAALCRGEIRDVFAR